VDSIISATWNAVTLHPQAQFILDLAERSTLPPLESLDAPAARIQYAETVAAVSGDPPAGVTTEEGTIPGPGGELPTRFYRPQDAEGPLPILVYFHGGGYVIGDRDTHDIPCRRLCLGAACLVVSVDYRLAPEFPFPAAVDDAWAATCWVVDHALALGGDPSRVAVGGDSAGGNLAAVVCHLAKRDGAPRFVHQLLIYPVTDLTGSMPSHVTLAQGYRLTTELLNWFMMHYIHRDGDRGQLIASPLFAEDFTGLPPALVLTAGYDPLRDEGTAYAAKLRDAGVETELVEYGGMIHGFITMGGVVDDAIESMDVCAAALARVFGTEG
jgi:acetyl esterase